MDSFSELVSCIKCQGFGCSVLFKTFTTPQAGVCQAPLFLEFSRQEFWSGWCFLHQGIVLIFLTQGSNPCLLHLLHWQADSLPLYHVFEFSSLSQSCPTICSPTDCSLPGFPDHHQHPELVETYVHQVGDAVQPSEPLSSPSPPALNLSQNQGLFWWPALLIKWPKYWSFSFNISPSNDYLGLISFRMDWFDPLATQGTLKSLFPTPYFKSINYSVFIFLCGPNFTYMTTGKTSFD